jgi:hypothetical protein
MTRWKDPETQKLLADLSAAGVSSREIAQQLGETKDAIASTMTRYGLFAEDARPGRRRRKITLASRAGG